jgi:hypothetical protein
MGVARRSLGREGDAMHPVDSSQGLSHGSSDGPSAGRSITTLSSREVYRNHWMRVREDEILRANGEKGIFGVVEKHDSAILLPIEDGRIWLVEQFRYAIQERALELPQGSWEMEIENAEELARGELREEIGMDAAPGDAVDRLRLSAATAARVFGHGADARPRRSRRRGARFDRPFRSHCGI